MIREAELFTDAGRSNPEDQLSGDVPRWTTSQPQAYSRRALQGRETQYATAIDQALELLNRASEILEEQARAVRIFREHVRNGEIYYGQHEKPTTYRQWLDPYLQAMRTFYEVSSRAFSETEQIRNSE